MTTDLPSPRVLRRAPSARATDGAAASVGSLGAASTVLRVVTALTVCVCLAGTVVGFLPETSPIFWYVTPLRLVLVIGLVALLLQGNPLQTFLTRLDAVFLLLLAAAGVATIRWEPTLSTWRWLLTLVLAYYLAVGVRRRWSGAGNAIAAAMLVIVGATSFIAFGQLSSPISAGWFCRDGFRDAACGTPGAMVRVQGSFTNPNLLAAFLVLALPLAVLAAWQLADPATRLVGLTVAAAGVAALALTLGRAGLIGLLVDVLAAASMLTAQRRRTSLAVRLGIGLLLLLVTVAALAVGIGVRRHVWAAGLATAAHHPLGVGLGRAGVYISARIPGNEQFAHAHDLWLNYLVETGVFGLAAVVAITVLVAMRLRVAVRGGDRTTIAVATGLAGFAVTCLVDDPANVSAVGVPLMIVLGMAATAPFVRGKRALR